MLEVENLSPFTRGFHMDKKEYIFKAGQVRSDIPDSFLNPNGTIKFAGILKLRRIIHDDGSSTRKYVKQQENYENGNQEWEYIFENIETGEKCITRHVTRFCDEHDLNITSIRVFIKQEKLYKSVWKIARRRFEDKKVIEGLYSKDFVDNN